VHLAYFTLVVDDAGRLQSRADIYGVDEKVKAALGLRG
jgi:murein L,D-transpeptidase YcbB/YkuD